MGGVGSLQENGYLRLMDHFIGVVQAIFYLKKHLLVIILNALLILKLA